MNTIRDILADCVRRFRQAGIDSPRLNAELLMARVAGVNRAMLSALAGKSLTNERLAEFEAMAARRLRREPIDYILGVREFYGREFAVRPGVLIPRPETETIVDILKRELPPEFVGVGADIGCGSGALAVTLACEFPGLIVVAADISAAALSVARENSARMGVQGRVFPVRMDGLSALRDGVSVVVSNPPYIDPAGREDLQPEVRDYEPDLALYGGRDGLAVAKDFLAQSLARVKPDGLCLFEHGADQGAAMRRLAREAGFRSAETYCDLSGLERVLLVRP